MELSSPSFLFLLFLFSFPQQENCHHSVRAEISLWWCRESGEEGARGSICLFCQWDNGSGETLGKI